MLKGKIFNKLKINLKILYKKLKIQSNKKTEIPTHHFCIVNYRPKSLCLQSTFKKKYITIQNKMNKSYTSSSFHAISTDIPDPLSPPLPNVHRFCQVLGATSRISTELLYVGSSWSSCLCTSMWRGPQEYITYELVPTFPAVSHILIVFVMGGRWPYSYCFVGCCLHDLFNIACSILV